MSDETPTAIYKKAGQSICRIASVRTRVGSWKVRPFGYFPAEPYARYSADGYTNGGIFLCSNGVVVEDDTSPVFVLFVDVVEIGSVLP